VRVADSAAGARDLVEKDTTIRPAQESGDRRLDVARRARVTDMSPEEMKRELLTSKVTGLPNRRAFDEADSPAVAMSDADGLKALNDKFGYAAGDALLRAKAEMSAKPSIPRCAVLAQRYKQSRPVFPA
jgi:GGDEF domain-containing protein